MPVSTISVWVGVATLTPLGIWWTTGCEKPSERLSLSPCAWARKPTPTSARRFSKPLVTPVTMLATSARMVPDMALAWRELPSALHSSTSPLFSTATLGSAARAMVPSGPLTEIWPEATLTSTPLGTGMGNFAMRDMAVLGDDAEDFAADAVGAGLAVGHDAARGRQDGDAQAVQDARNVVAAAVDAQAGLGDALQALDHRAAGVVLEGDAQLLHHPVLAQREVLDVALVLQDLGDRRLQARGRHRHLGVADHLRVANAGQHIRDGVAHAHRWLLTLISTNSL